MTAIDSLSDQSQANATMLRLAGWSFEFDSQKGSVIVTSPDGIPYFYDVGQEDKAIADAMSLHLGSRRQRAGSFAHD